MSSYFDEMTRQIAQAEQTPDSEKVRTLFDTVRTRIADYLAWIDKNALKSEREKVDTLKAEYDAILARGVRFSASYLVGGDLHSLGHDIGRAQIKIRGGRRCGDSPYFPGHYGID